MIFQLIEKGGPLMYALVACSLVSMTFIFERTYFWWKLYRSRQEGQIVSLLNQLKNLTHQKKPDHQKTRQLDSVEANLGSASGSGFDSVSGSEDPVLRVMAVGFKNLGRDMMDHIQVASTRELRRMRSYQTALDTVIVIAPLLGILGTVTGIIGSFDLLSHTGLSDVQLVTAGIAEALITTATGLVIAILTVVPSQLFQSRLQREKERMENWLTEFEVLTRDLALEASEAQASSKTSSTQLGEHRL